MLVRSVLRLSSIKLLIRIGLSSALLAAASAGEARCCKVIRTNFGYVSLPRRDVATGIEVGNEVSKIARNVFGLGTLRFAIIDGHNSKYHWGDTTPEGLPVFPWSFVHGTDYIATQPPNHVLRHEIGHELFRRYVMPDTHPGQYGTDAPDWLDEAVAVAFEAPEIQATRRCDAASLLKANTLIPLGRFLAMEHPDLAATQAQAAGGMRVRKLTFDTSASQETPAFYAMSLAFPEYVATRARSASALAEMIRAVRAGTTIEKWLGERLGGSGHKPDLRELDRDFLTWLSSDERYQCRR